MRTQRRAPVVLHVRNPDDLILNTAQMRDAVHLQKFRIPPPALDERAVIDASVRRVIDQRKRSNGSAEKGGRVPLAGRASRG